VIPFLDPEVLRRNPKVFLGYSDTTSIHLFYQKHGLVTFYGPSIMSGFASKGGLERYTEDALKPMIEGAEFPLPLEPNSTGVPAEMLNWDDYKDEAVAPARIDERPWVFRQGKGRHDGRSIGGCFEILSLMANGTSIWPSLSEWEDRILLLEISFEMADPEFVVWFFRSLQAQGILKRLKGIIFGKNHWREVPAELDEKIGSALHKMIQVECNLPNLPVITGVHFGHICPAMTLPLGVRMEIDCDAQIIRVLESPVI
jgi:muramoyltetrapeptide carboxypeptidase LdcA involved in peptidoglycan recycling